VHGALGLRVLRAAGFAAASTVLAALAHSAGGGMLPPVGVLLCAAVGLTVAAVPSTRRERGLPVIAAATLIGQLTLHVVLTLAMAPACGRSATDGVTGGVAVPGSMSMGTSTDSGAGCTGESWLPTGAGTGGWVMLVGHLLAAAVVACALRRGERALSRLAVLVGRVLGPVGRRLLAVVAVGCPPIVARPVFAAGPASGPPIGRPGLLGTQVWVRRGPPGAGAA